MIENDKDENDIPYMGSGDRCYLSAVLYFTDWKYIIIIIKEMRRKHQLFPFNEKFQTLLCNISVLMTFFEHSYKTTEDNVQN